MFKYDFMVEKIQEVIDSYEATGNIFDGITFCGKLCNETGYAIPSYGGIRVHELRDRVEEQMELLVNEFRPDLRSIGAVISGCRMKIKAEDSELMYVNTGNLTCAVYISFEPRYLSAEELLRLEQRQK